MLPARLIQALDSYRMWKESMFSYTEAKQFLVESLRRDAIAHEAGRYRDVGQAFDEFDANLSRDDRPEFNKLFVALNF
jgi:hypothetical protein